MARSLPALKLGQPESEAIFRRFAKRAMKASDRALAFSGRPDQAAADSLMKRARQTRSYADEVPLLFRALEAAPRDGSAWFRLGEALARMQLDAEAETACRRVMDFAPPGELHLSHARLAVGQFLIRRGAFEEGLAVLEEARCDPNLQGPAVFKLGGYRRAFGEDREWRGGRCSRLLVVQEGGLGDQIQYARFVPLLRQFTVDGVAMGCSPMLARLFQRSLPVTVRPWDEPHLDDAWLDSFDAWVAPPSIPHRLGATLDGLWRGPYLRSPDVERGAAPQGVRVGIKITGNPRHPNDQNRSIARAAWTVTPPDGASLASLEPVDTGAQDFADTAALVETCDLVIAVDTSVAHLAGAMGKPVWILLPAFEVDVRWMRDQADSPWYPTAKLYRQAPGDSWAVVLDQVQADLDAFVRARAAELAGRRP